MIHDSAVRTYKFVNYLWDDAEASTLQEDQVGLFLYRSHLLGADLRITNFGGGNTSCKTTETDPLTMKPVEVMWIKGSGGDIGTLKLKGVASLFTEKLHLIKHQYRGLEFEDEMVEKFNYCLYDPKCAAPSIDTPLHGLLPYKHIDHLHPDAIISIAASKDGMAICQEIFDERIGWIPWQRPGFDLGIKLENFIKDHPDLDGLILESHGLFTWGETSYDCYVNSLNTIEKAAAYIAQKTGKNRPVFGGENPRYIHSTVNEKVAATLAPILRGLCSQNQRMVGHFTADPRVMEFVNSNDLKILGPMGTSCPDHFLRTKIQPLIVEINDPADLNNDAELIESLAPIFEQYRNEYTLYYSQYANDQSPKIRDSNPVIILVPGIGMYAFAKNKQTARVAAEFYINAINVMRGAEAISKYVSLPREEAFKIEYWLLEEAKLQRQPKEKPLSRKVALVTGAGGGIGNAIVQKLIAEGANVVCTDISEDFSDQIQYQYDKDTAIGLKCDITKEEDISSALEKASIQFGGIDIIIHSAGMAISKSLSDTTQKDWDILQDVLVKGQFLLAKSASSLLKKQGIGGDFIHIASKNGVVAGPNNVAYGTAKAAQQHMTRLLASELAEFGIRVNTINPDGVIIGSKIWEGAWAEGRAKAYGIEVNELPKYYAQRNLLKEIIRPEDIANGVFAVLLLDKSTGNTINVDGGIAAAFLR